MSITIITFLSFLLLFVVIGIFSIKKSKETTVDYLLAGHSIKPWMVGLSAVATNNSGYMFIGMIGYTYMVGLPSIWLMFGWLVGDFIASLIVHKKLRVVSEKLNAHSFGGILSHWHNQNFSKLRKIVGLISIIFLASYAAAQLNAGSKALHVLFGWQEYAGAIIGTIIILLYSYSGGIRASIWTDSAQSIVMLFAMSILVISGISELGGTSEFIQKLYSVNETYLNWFKDESLVAKISFVVGWVFGGFAVIGQPHIMIRFMTMDSPKNLNRVRFYYYSWFFIFYGLTIIVGLLARLYIPNVNNFDAELALPTLSTMLLPNILVGVILAGIFSATISTADSLVLSCSASLTRDFTKEPIENFKIAKIGTLIVTLLALIIALFSSSSVFALVLDSWGVLASAFAPLLVIYAFERKVSEIEAISMVIGGVLTLYLWKLFLPNIIYEVVPGIISGFIIFYIFKLIKK